jgi:hypothetical protein
MTKRGTVSAASLAGVALTGLPFPTLTQALIGRDLRRRAASPDRIAQLLSPRAIEVTDAARWVVGRCGLFRRATEQLAEQHAPEHNTTRRVDLLQD